MMRLTLFELNEVNFDFVKKYIAAGALPTFRALIDRFGVVETTSESEYVHLEPWIQWVTAHTGMSYDEHRLFRLGDVHDSDVRQIWEHLEESCGAIVGAVSPMNAANRTKNSPFFVPDPWTGGRISGPASMRSLYDAIAQAVNENAAGSSNVSMFAKLLLGLLRFGRLRSFPGYFAYAAGSARGKWRKALVLDRLLADLYLTQWRKSRPDFSTLFLNAAAHIQHHYMFSSAAYDGAAKNPEWYVSPAIDPVLEVYSLYDRILAEIMELPDTRVIVATGLHQDPHDEVTYYYRLINHESFLKSIGMVFDSVEPRMSRDFLVRFRSPDDARRGQALLESAVAGDGLPVFSADNRGDSIFAMLTYPRQIGPDFRMTVGKANIARFDTKVAFVAIKNGEHNGIGYLVDTGKHARDYGSPIPLAQVFDLCIEAVVRFRTAM